MLQVNNLSPSTDSEQPQSLARVSTVQALSDAISDQIFSGELPTGASLREADLATRYGVGRHSVRAAIQQLVSNGIVRHEAHRGAAVARLDAGDVRDVYLIRLSLETEAAGVLSGDEARLEPVFARVDALEALHESSTWGELMLADLRVHQALVGAMSSHRADQIFSALISQLRLCLAQLSDRELRRSSAGAEHRAFLDEIAAGNRDAAASLLRRHLTEGRDDVAAALDEALRQ